MVRGVGHIVIWGLLIFLLIGMQMDLKVSKLIWITYAIIWSNIYHCFEDAPQFLRWNNISILLILKNSIAMDDLVDLEVPVNLRMLNELSFTTSICFRYYWCSLTANMYGWIGSVLALFEIKHLLDLTVNGPDRSIVEHFILGKLLLPYTGFLSSININDSDYFHRTEHKRAGCHRTDADNLHSHSLVCRNLYGENMFVEQQDVLSLPP